MNRTPDIAAMVPRDARRVFLAERIDPRALIAYLAAVTTVAFSADHPLVLAVLVPSVWAVVVSTVPEREYRPFLLYGALAGLGVMLLNPIASQAGSTVLLSGPSLPVLGPTAVTAEAVAYGAAMMLRLLTVAGAFALYACLVDADALFRLISPHSPSAAVVLGLSTRLYPVMARDAARIADAQRCRGQRLSSGSWLARAKANVPVLNALVLSSLERAFDTAEALESRGFGRTGRSRLPSRRLAPRDVALLAVSGIALVTALLALLGPARFAFYPTLSDATTAPAFVSAGVLGVLATFPALMAWGWTQWPWLRSRI